MYVVTFYSFKGGVGRSMALVNVAADLAARGRRVLIVDFDLEAPGLDTFDVTRADNNSRGLVDFICDYRRTGEVPDVRNYIYQKLIPEAGEFWVMPAGDQTAQYDESFRSIDWEQLYGSENGFLLFEDLKAQWKEALHLDYVLVDSRTGHTDVGGICTRQLPDAVVALFFPNEQNRRGLQSIVTQIRGEFAGPLKRKIELHFVMSNVPDLDDEDEILAGEVELFERTLDFESPTAIIHHYDSLALLEQVAFVRERPRSRLAKEYRDLTSAIVRKNLEDREGALAFLDRSLRRVGTRDAARYATLEEQLQEIRVKHSRDAEVLRKLAGVRRKQRKPEEALAILDDSLAVAVGDTDTFLARAELYAALAQKDRAVADLKQVLSMGDADSFDMTIALRMLREMQPDMVQLVSRSPALGQLDLDFDLIRELERSPETLSTAEQLLERWSSRSMPSARIDATTNELVVCLIGQGSYKKAVEVFGATRPDLAHLDIADCFNYSMATWGYTGAPVHEYLARVVELSKEAVGKEEPNFLQCSALAYWLIGDKSGAQQLIDKARGVAVRRRSSAFSGWSYLMVSFERFVSDLEEMERSFKSEDLVPEFIRRNPPSISANSLTE
jgi:cellulose biosynthesis protein BcsQ